MLCPLTEQWKLLGLVSPDEIGVRLTASVVLFTRESTSIVIRNRTTNDRMDTG